MKPPKNEYAKNLDSLDPVKNLKIRKERTFVRLPKPVKERLEIKAKQMGISLNSLIIHACIEILKEFG